jgi:hypothetical protein
MDGRLAVLMLGIASSGRERRAPMMCDVLWVGWGREVVEVVLSRRE